MRKQRIHLRLTNKTIDQLEQVAHAPGVTKSAIVEDALAAYFDPSRKESREAVLMRRMDGYDLRQSAIERDTTLTVETLGQFILYWLTRTAPLPDGERDIAHALGQKRFNYFIEQVAAKIGEPEGLTARVLPIIKDES